MINKMLSCLLMIVLILSLTACGEKETETKENIDVPTTTKESSEEKTEDAKSKIITLKFMGTEVRENIDTDVRVKAYFDAIDKFMADHPNVKIEHEGIPHDAYQQKIQVLAAANELPDVLDVKGSWNRNFVENNLITDLKPFINNDANWKSIIKETANLNFQIDDSVYGLSIESGGSTSMIYYNEDIFKECGIAEFPKTINEFYEAIEKIKSKGYTPISMGNKGKWLAESCYLSTLGNRFTGTDWTTSIINRTGNAKFTDQPFIDALAFMQDLAKRGAFNSDLNSIDYKQQRVPYYNKKAAMFVEGFWAISSVINDAPEDVAKATKITIFPDLLTGKGSANMTTGGPGGWAKSISKKLDGPARDAAIEWLKYYISVENATALYNNGIIPGMESDGYDKEKLHRLQLEYFDLMSTIEPCDVYDLTFDPAVESVLEAGLQELLIHSITPEKLANRIQKEFEKTAPAN